MLTLVLDTPLMPAIQTFHISSDAETCEPLTPATIRNLQPGETVVFGLYGVLANGLVEHIADRESWEEAVGLVLRLRKTG